MNIYGKNKIKDYDSLDETQNIKTDNYLDSEEINANGISKKKLLFLIGGAIVLLIFFCIIFSIFKSKNTQEGNAQRYIDNQILQQPVPLFQQNQISSNSQKNEIYKKISKIHQMKKFIKYMK